MGRKAERKEREFLPIEAFGGFVGRSEKHNIIIIREANYADNKLYS